MNAFQTYKLYRSLKLHFSTEKYDYFKYKGRVPGITETKFYSSKDKYWAEKICNIYNDKTGNFLLCNLSNKPNVYIRDLINMNEYSDFYNDWYAYKSASKYRFKQDLEKLSHEQLFESDCGIPTILQKVLRKEIHRETMCIVLKVSDALTQINEEQKGNILWEQYNLGIEKYLPFVKLKPIYSEIMLDKFGKIGYK